MTLPVESCTSDLLVSGYSHLTTAAFRLCLWETGGHASGEICIPYSPSSPLLPQLPQLQCIWVGFPLGPARPGRQQSVAGGFGSCPQVEVLAPGLGLAHLWL